MRIKHLIGILAAGAALVLAAASPAQTIKIGVINTYPVRSRRSAI
jgi:hypothetical protein